MFSKCEEEKTVSNHCVLMVDIGFGLSNKDQMYSEEILAEKWFEALI